jgi:hypothetical protein
MRRKRNQQTPSALIRHLQGKVPTNFAIRTKWVPLLDDNAMGMCEFKEPRGRRPYFLISFSRSRLPKDPPWHVIWELVVHEYAHALVWTPAARLLNDHGPIWGVAYAEVYRAAEKFL